MQKCMEYNLNFILNFMLLYTRTVLEFTILTPTTITKRLVVSKVSEFFAPIGLFKPIKLQLKLELRKLSGVAWEEEVSPEQQSNWKTNLTEFVDLHELTAPRCIIPADNVSASKIRLKQLNMLAELLSMLGESYSMEPGVAQWFQQNRN